MGVKTGQNGNGRLTNSLSIEKQMLFAETLGRKESGVFKAAQKNFPGMISDISSVDANDAILCS
jgi:hypothetical protein